MISQHDNPETALTMTAERCLPGHWMTWDMVKSSVTEHGKLLGLDQLVGDGSSIQRAIIEIVAGDVVYMTVYIYGPKGLKANLPEPLKKIEFYEHRLIGEDAVYRMRFPVRALSIEAYAPMLHFSG